MTDSTIKIKPTTKIELCLTELLKRRVSGITELEAFSAYGETALHSTISTLANSKGLVFKRIREPHLHRQGRNTHFTRYWLLDDNEVIKAKALVTQCQINRGLLIKGDCYAKTSTESR